MKKIIALVMSAVLAVGVFAGCGGKQVAADEYVLAMYKLVINRDSKAAKDVGVADKEIKSFEDELKKSVETGINDINESYKKSYNATVDKDLLTKYYDAYLKALTKLSGTATVEKSSDTEATVKLTSTYMDMEALTGKAMEAASAKVKAAEYSEQTDYNIAVLTEYIKELTTQMEQFTPGKETQSTTIVVKKSKNSWTYSDSTTFAQAITSLAIKNS
ncbi:MAG: hypothetical protein E7241_02225 [Lachnospiraceae bacterium]|nr:hypothetical protein [Lachnospiraceae bacterium]